MKYKTTPHNYINIIIIVFLYLGGGSGPLGELTPLWLGTAIVSQPQLWERIILCWSFCPRSDGNKQKRCGVASLNSMPSNQDRNSEPVSGLRKNVNNGGHEHCLFVAGLWSKHSLSNHSFKCFLEFVQPTTAHVVPEPLFLRFSILFLTASISELTSKTNRSLPKRK